MAFFYLLAPKEGVASSNDFVINGEISKNDSTSIQVGTRVIQDLGKESSNLNLDNYLNQTITISGSVNDGNNLHIELNELRDLFYWYDTQMRNWLFFHIQKVASSYESFPRLFLQNH